MSGELQIKPMVGYPEVIQAFKALHNTIGRCPVCGAAGTFDTLSPAGSMLPPGTNWIWYNPHSRSWECGECWLK